MAMISCTAAILEYSLLNQLCLENAEGFRRDLRKHRHIHEVNGTSRSKYYKTENQRSCSSQTCYHTSLFGNWRKLRIPSVPLPNSYNNDRTVHTRQF